MLIAVYQTSNSGENSGVDDGEAPMKQQQQLKSPVKRFKHLVEITTETDVMRLPVEGEVATADEFRRMFGNNFEAGKEKHVRIISVRPENIRRILTKPFLPTRGDKLSSFDIDAELNKELDTSFDQDI